MKHDLRQASVADLVEMFKEFGLEKSRIQQALYENWEDRVNDYNCLMSRMMPVQQELAARGHDAEAQLLPLLEHPDRWLRWSVAQQVVSVDEQKARAAIERVLAEAHQYDRIRGYAGMTLEHWDGGTAKGIKPSRPPDDGS